MLAFIKPSEELVDIRSSTDGVIIEELDLGVDARALASKASEVLLGDKDCTHGGEGVGGLVVGGALDLGLVGEDGGLLVGKVVCRRGDDGVVRSGREERPWA